MENRELKTRELPPPPPPVQGGVRGGSPRKGTHFQFSILHFQLFCKGELEGVVWEWKMIQSKI